MSAEAVKVIVRCRPLNTRENDLKCNVCIQMESQRGQCLIQNPADKKSPPKPFFFDGAYYMDSTTEGIYADIGYPLVEGVTEGYNGTIFAYGQTGCGKSFTMQGINDPPTQRGIIPRSFDHIFETISVSKDIKFLVHASYLEIYNEEIRDLLGKDIKARLDLKEHPERGVYVAGLSMHKVSSVKECQVVMDRGWKNRATGATLMNADSSRSHSIFTIFLEMAEYVDDEEKIRAGKLNLVDLAGSERQSKTGSTGDRLKEATKINLSLSALGNVISALVDGKSKHIPYRDSKLTRLLQDSLGGNTKTLMVACLSPADNNYDETLSTLRYANRAKNIQNKPKINEDPKDALLREYQEEIEKLKAMLAGQIPINFDPKAAASNNTAAVREQHRRDAEIAAEREKLEAERRQIREEYEAKLREKEDLYAQEAADKAKLHDDMQKLRQFYDDRINSLDERYRDLPTPSQAAVSTDSSVHPPADHSRAAPREPATPVAGGEQQLPAPEVGVVIMGQDGAMSMSKTAAAAVEEEHIPPQQTVQQAVHIRSQASASSKGRQPPVPQPTAAEPMTQEEVLIRAEERLQALESVMVGGEQANNTEVIERRKKKKKHVEERKRRLAEANSGMEDEGIMVGIYESIQDELRAKNKQLQRANEQSNALEREILDLQSEFEFDRIDYLDTIRKQERTVELLSGILDRIQPLLRRDCNYYNLDRIKSQAKWDEERECWLLPQLMVERTSLPSTAPGAAPATTTSYGINPGHGGYDSYDGYQEDRFYNKLADKEPPENYFANNRANRILAETRAAEPSRSKRLGRPQMNHHSAPVAAMPASAGMGGGYGSMSNGSYMNDGGSGGGGLHSADEMQRRPARLESLPPPTTAGRKGRRKQREF